VTGLVAAAIGMLVALAADIVASRAGAARLTAYGASLFAGLFAVLPATVLLPGGVRFDTIGIAVLSYGAWWFAFLNLAQALESSLRVRLLNEVRAAGGRMRRSALEQRYNDAILLSLRLDRLLKSGAVVESDGRLHVRSASLKTIAAFFRFLRLALMGRVSEFEAPAP
jgi:hypothetical protein